MRDIMLTITENIIASVFTLTLLVFVNKRSLLNYTFKKCKNKQIGHINNYSCQYCNSYDSKLNELDALGKSHTWWTKTTVWVCK